jgi:hypothetical protein
MPLEVAAASDTASASKSVYVQLQIQKLSSAASKEVSLQGHNLQYDPQGRRGITRGRRGLTQGCRVLHETVGCLESLQKGATASKPIFFNFIVSTKMWCKPLSCI